MPISAPVRLGSNAAASGSGTATLQPATAPALGDALVLRVAWRTNTSSVSSVTDNRGNTWVAMRAGAGTTNVRSAIYICKLPAVLLTTLDTITVTFSAGQGRWAAVLDSVSGLTTLADVDRSAGAVGTSATPNSGATATTTYANEIALGVFAADAGNDTLNSVNNAWTAESKVQSGTTTSDITLYPLYKILSATGAQTASGTLSVSRNWEALAATLQEPQGTVQRRASGEGVEVAYVTSQRAGSEIATEVAHTTPTRGVSSVSTEVAFTAISGRAAGLVITEVAAKTTTGATGFVGAEASITGQRVSAGFTGAEAATVGPNKGSGFIGVELAYVGVRGILGFVGAEVSYRPVAIAATRRVSPQVIG